MANDEQKSNIPLTNKRMNKQMKRERAEKKNNNRTDIHAKLIKHGEAH